MAYDSAYVTAIKCNWASLKLAIFFSPIILIYKLNVYLWRGRAKAFQNIAQNFWVF
jgi:hypothetical protein